MALVEQVKNNNLKKEEEENIGNIHEELSYLSVYMMSVRMGMHRQKSNPYFTRPLWGHINKTTLKSVPGIPFPSTPV